jgi:GT2 family glycosyltransferase
VVVVEGDLVFDERFRGSAVREESDFCLHIRQTGYTIWYSPDAYLIHLGEESGGCHDISTRTVKYQITFYHNHFLMGLKNLTPGQNLRFFSKLFDCHVLGHPPCNKCGSPIKVATRLLFYVIGFLQAAYSLLQTLWDHGQHYSQMDSLSITKHSPGEGRISFGERNSTEKNVFVP